jgi:hypothetical protein
MRKKLALLLVLALIVSMVPMSVFAASKNTVSKVVKVKDDAYLNDDDVPYVKIKNDSNDFANDEIFRLKLETAEWLENGDRVNVSESTYGVEDNKIDEFEEFMAEQIANLSYAKTGGVGKLLDKEDVNIRRISDKTLEVTVSKEDGYEKDDEIRVPLFVEMDGKGDAKVTVEAMDSNVSSGTYTFAVGSTGDTITTIDDVKSFADPEVIKTIQIDEAAVGAIDRNKARKVKLKLPTNFKWINLGEAAVEFGGSFSSGNARYFATRSDAEDYAKFLKDDGGKDVSSASDLKGTLTDDRTIEFYIVIDENAPGTRGTIYVKGLTIDTDKNAKNGEVTMTISGDDITTEDIVVADYIDYEIRVEAKEEPKELVSGRYAVAKYSDDEEYKKRPELKDEDKHKLTKLIIEEDVANSWLVNRKTRVEFPSWVKILDVRVTDSDNLKAPGDKGGTSNSAIEDVLKDAIDSEDNYIEFKLEKSDDTDDDTMIELEFYVSIEAGKDGDIEAIVGGSALDKEQTVVLGKAYNPVSVEVEPVDIRTGIKNQELNKIVLTEGKADAIEKGDLILRLEEGLKWTDVPEIEVTDGNIDLDLDIAKVGGDKDRDLIIKVKSESSKASVIEITGAKIDLTRYVAEGDVELKVTGDAVVRNSTEITYQKRNEIEVSEVQSDMGGFKEEYTAKVNVAKVITPADSDVGAAKEVVFTIGEGAYKVDGVEKTMDTAPYIKDGRTMLPVRYVAEALGVSEDNIIWNNATRTVTIFKGNRTVFITIGSAELKVNGTPLYMDTVAEIKDDRTMLPISFVGKALGAQVDWDDATRTVTIK